MADLLVVGTGLIGTSVGLALRGQADVLLSDPDPAAVDVAVQRGAGRAWDGREAYAHCLVAAPPSAVAAVVAGLAAEACGAEPVLMTAEEHDEAVALVSHLPQVAASAVAAVLAGTSGRLDLAGPGLQDTTRVAASDPRLWVELLRQNAAAVAPLVRALGEELASLGKALDDLATDPAAQTAPVEDLLLRGNAGRALVPRKRGEHDRDFVLVSVSVTDEPGQLAGVLVSAAEAGINVEDVRVEHLPGRPTGVIELLVHPDAQSSARRALSAAGWSVVGG